MTALQPSASYEIEIEHPNKLVDVINNLKVRFINEDSSFIAKI